MSMPTVSPKSAFIDRRLNKIGIQIEHAVVFVGCLVTLALDTQGLSLVPLVGSLQTTYGLSAGQAAWTFSAPAIVGAGFAPTLVRVGDKLGMRTVVLGSLAVGVLGNLLCAVATDFPLLVIGRAILGLGGAALPLVYAILRARGTSERRTTRGMALLSFAGGLGVALAFLLGGVVLQNGGGIRTVFWILTAIAALALVAAWWLLPDGNVRTVHPIDWIGAAGVSIGLVGVVLALTEGNTWGWSSSAVLISLIGGAVVLALWAFYQSRRSYPLVDVRRLSNRSAAPSLFILALFASLGAVVNLGVVLNLQLPTLTGYGFGLTVLETAYVICVASVTMMAGGAVCGRVISRFGPRPVMVLGILVMAATFLWFAYNHSKLWEFIVFTAVWGVVYAFVLTAAFAAYFEDAKPTEAGMYASASIVAQTAGGGIGPALFVAILTSKTIPGTPIPDPVVFEHMWIYSAIATVILAAIAAVVRRPHYVPAEEPVPVDQADRATT